MNFRLLFFVILLLFGNGVSFASDDPSAITALEWRSSSLNQKMGYIYGFTECISRDNIKKGFLGSFNENIQKINELTSDHNTDSTTPVWALELALLSDKITLPVCVGQFCDNGLFWGNLYSAPRGEATNEKFIGGQIGYVDGYLECHKYVSKITQPKFSRSASYYVAEINSWYGINYETGDYNDLRINNLIVSVLKMLHD